MLSVWLSWALKRVLFHLNYSRTAMLEVEHEGMSHTLFTYCLYRCCRAPSKIVSGDDMTAWAPHCPQQHIELLAAGTICRHCML